MILVINKFKEAFSWNAYNMVEKEENKTDKKNRLRLEFST